MSLFQIVLLSVTTGSGFLFSFIILLLDSRGWFNNPRVPGALVALGALFLFVTAVLFTVGNYKNEAASKKLSAIVRNNLVTLVFSIFALGAVWFLLGRHKIFLDYQIQLIALKGMAVFVLYVYLQFIVLKFSQIINKDSSFTRKFESRKTENVLVASFLVGLIFLFFSPVLITGRVPLNSDYLLSFDPWNKVFDRTGSIVNPVLSDTIDSRTPNRIFFNNSIEKGEFPLWNPYISSGTPFGMLLFAGTFSISNLSTLLFGPLWGTLVYHIAKLFILGYFMYLFLRKLEISVFPSLLGAITAMFSSYIIVNLAQMVIDSVIYLPVILYLGETFILEKKPTILLIISLMIMMMILSGFPAITIYSILLAAFYFAFRTILVNPSDQKMTERLKSLGLIAGSFVVGLLLSSFSLFPTAEFFANINLSYRKARAASRLNPYFLLRTLIGNVCGNPVEKTYICESNFNETAIYLGLLPWLLLPFSLVSKKNRKIASFFLVTALAIFAIVFGLGDIHKLVGNLPLFNLSSNTRMIAELPIIFAILSAFSLEAIIHLRKQHKKQLLILLLVVSLLLIVGLVYFISTPFIIADYDEFADQQAIGALIILGCSTICILIFLISKYRSLRYATVALLVAIQFLDMTTLLATYNGASEINSYFQTTPGIDFLQGELEDSDRIIMFGRQTMVPSFPLAYSINTMFGHWWTSEEYRAVTSLIDPSLFNKFVTTQPIFSIETTNLTSPLVNLYRIKYFIRSANSPIQLTKTSTVAQLEYNQSIKVENEEEIGQSIVSSTDSTFAALSLRIVTEQQNQLEAKIDVLLNGENVVSQETIFTPDELGRWYTAKFEPTEVKINDEISFQVVFTNLSVPVYLHVSTVDQIPGVMSLSGNETSYDLGFILADKEGGAYYDYPVVYKDDITVFENDHLPESLPVVFEIIQSEPKSCPLTLNDIDPYQTAITEKPLSIIKAVSQPSGTAYITNYNLNDLVIETNMNNQALVVLSDTWFPGWKAFVDGEEVEIIRTNCAMRGVLVEPGNHEIKMIYKPESVRIGSIISILTLIASFTTIIFINIRVSRKPEETVRLSEQQEYDERNENKVDTYN